MRRVTKAGILPKKSSSKEEDKKKKNPKKITLRQKANYGYNIVGNKVIDAWGPQRFLYYVCLTVLPLLLVYFIILPKGYLKLMCEITFVAVVIRGVMKLLNDSEVLNSLFYTFIDKDDEKNTSFLCFRKKEKPSRTKGDYKQCESEGQKDQYVKLRFDAQSKQSSRQIAYKSKNGKKIIYFPEKQAGLLITLGGDIGKLAVTWYWFTVIIFFTVYVSFNWATDQRKAGSVYFSEGGGHENMEEVMEILEKILAVLMPLYFIQQLEKFKQSRKLYQSICGDIKSMAFYILALTNNEVKYNVEDFKGRTQINENGKLPDAFGKIGNQKGLNIRVERTFAKIRYILAALPQTAKHTVREKIDNDFVFDPKKVTFGSFKRKEDRCCNSLCGPFWSSYKKPDYVNPPELIGVWYSEEDSFGRTLYLEMVDVKNRTNLDYFEVLMFMLLRYINRLKEIKINKTRLINEGLERDIIGKWHHIYNAWGPMVTNQTFTPPGIINILFYGGLSIIAVFKPWKYLEKEYGLTYSIINIAAFALLLIVGKFIQNPFVRSGFAPSISPDASETQEQLVRLMQQHVALDQNYLYGYNLKKNKDDEFVEWVEQKDRENLEYYDRCLVKPKDKKFRRFSGKDYEIPFYSNYSPINGNDDDESKEDEVRKGEKTEGEKDSDENGTPINTSNEYTIQLTF